MKQTIFCLATLVRVVDQRDQSCVQLMKGRGFAHITQTNKCKVLKTVSKHLAISSDGIAVNHAGVVIGANNIAGAHSTSEERRAYDDLGEELGFLN